MAKVFSGLFGGGKKEKKEPPVDQRAEQAKANALRQARSAAGYRSTILGSIYDSGKKSLLGQ